MYLTVVATFNARRYGRRMDKALHLRLSFMTKNLRIFSVLPATILRLVRHD
jgi:hypothetical protein